MHKHFKLSYVRLVKCWFESKTHKTDSLFNIQIVLIKKLDFFFGSCNPEQLSSCDNPKMILIVFEGKNSHKSVCNKDVSSRESKVGR